MSYNDVEASDKQYALMDRLGIEYDEAGVSVGEARELIKKKLESQKPKDVTAQYGEKSPKFKSVDGEYTAQLDKDTLIVRQSCLKAAVEYASKLGTNKDDTIKLAEEFEKWVFR